MLTEKKVRAKTCLVRSVSEAPHTTASAGFIHGHRVFRKGQKQRATSPMPCDLGIHLGEGRIF